MTPAKSHQHGVNSPRDRPPVDDVHAVGRDRSLIHHLAMRAMVDAVHARGWARATMSDIADTVGVSRTALYNHCGSKDQLAIDYADRRIKSVISAIEETLSTFADDPRRGLQQGLARGLEALRGDPLLSAIATDPADAANLLPVVIANRQRLLDHWVQGFAGVIARWFPEHRESAPVRANTMVRMLISYVLLPGDLPADSAYAIVAAVMPGRAAGNFPASGCDE